MEDFFWRGRGGGGGANGGVIFRSTSSLHLQRRPRGGGRVSWNFPSFLVRATAGRFVAPPMLSDATPDTDARQIADPPYNWGYSKPVVVLDVAWNSLFVLVSAAVLLWASRERPETPIRAWVLVGIALCCCLPCLIAFFHAIVGQEGASDTNLSNLPRFRYCQNNQLHKLGQENENEISITIAEEDSSLMDLCLPPEDSCEIHALAEVHGEFCWRLLSTIYHHFEIIITFTYLLMNLLFFFHRNAAFASLITKMAWSYTHFPATITSIQIALLNGSRLVPHAPSASSIYSEDHDGHLLRGSCC
ncbi:hypothetical protein ZIOFF_003384 [Zingiber officinale]|uniref:Uncharacterized protein n=1 Tax=Zingiber officinale TaxID=94328 RepID=A0A8J5HXN1_ZINOF|nr:hypothetical protein ZIOFF_003384 [Zingiber officinale]